MTVDTLLGVGLLSYVALHLTVEALLTGIKFYKTFFTNKTDKDV